MDRVVEMGRLQKEGQGRCCTDGYILDGGENWYPTSFIRLIQDYGLDIDVRKYEDLYC